MLNVKIDKNEVNVKASGCKSDLLSDLCCANASIISGISSTYKELVETIDDVYKALLLAVKEGKIKPEGGK